MTQRPYEVLARFGGDGKVAGVSVRHITTVNGKEYEGDPQPLSGTDDPAFAVFAESFSAAVVAERDTLAADKAALTTELATANATIATRETTIAASEATIADRDVAITTLQSQLAELVAERDALQAEVTRLIALVPPPASDYEVTRSEFLARLQAVDASIILDIWKAQSPEAIMAAVALFTHDGLVDLRPNSRTHQMLQFLIHLGIITEDQVQSLLVEG